LSCLKGSKKEKKKAGRGKYKLDEKAYDGTLNTQGRSEKKEAR